MCVSTVMIYSTVAMFIIIYKYDTADSPYSGNGFSQDAQSGCCPKQAIAELTQVGCLSALSHDRSHPRWTLGWQAYRTGEWNGVAMRLK